MTNYSDANHSKPLRMINVLKQSLQLLPNKQKIHHHGPL